MPGFKFFVEKFENIKKTLFITFYSFNIFLDKLINKKNI